MASNRNKARPLNRDTNRIGKEGQSYLTMYHGKATDSLAGMSTRDAIVQKETGNAIIDTGEVKLVIQKLNSLKATLGVNTHKLLSVGIASFTDLNNYTRRKDSPLRYEVAIPLKEYAIKCGYDVTEHPTATEEEAEKEKKRAKNALDNARKAIKKDLLTLQASTLTWEEKVKGKAKDFDSMGILGRVAIKKGIIYMEFTVSIAEYLAQLPQTQYPIALLGVDARNQNAYTLGLKLWEHFNNDNNQKKNTANILKVDTLLQYTNLPSYEAVTASRQYWQDRIKTPLEKALDSLVKDKVINSWGYTHSKSVELTEEEAYTITDYETFRELYISYELTEAPDHTERLARREAEKEERKAKRKKKKN